MDPQSLKELNAAKRARKAVILLTEIETGRDRLVLESDTVSGELGEAIAKAFGDGKSRMLEIDGSEYFLNVHIPAPRIVVIGAVHISQALAQIAKTAGYDLEVIDPRTAFATPERFQGVSLHADWPETVLKAHPLDAFTALVAVTHDPKIDDFPIKAALESNCFYVGALGSRKTHAKRLERLAASGVASAELDRICAPIGLDIGASSPQEIAIAIMAEIIGAFRKRSLKMGDSSEVVAS